MYKKYDEGKNQLELIDPGFILGVGKVLTFGAIKYDPDNWKNAKPEDRKRSVGSLLRHTMAYQSGEMIDPESGIEHLYHMATNIMFMAWYDKEAEKLNKVKAKKARARAKTRQADKEHKAEDSKGQTYMEVSDGSK